MANTVHVGSDHTITCKNVRVTTYTGRWTQYDIPLLSLLSCCGGRTATRIVMEVQLNKWMAFGPDGRGLCNF